MIFFPLPLPLDPWTRSKLASADMIYGLNVYACGLGSGPPPKREPCGIVENLGKLCERFKVWEEPLGNLDFGDFFAKRGVTYDGEEVRVAQTLTWIGVQGSLPDEVGRLELRDFCTQGTLHYIDHFEDHLLDTSHMTCPRAPSPKEGSRACRCRRNPGRYSRRLGGVCAAQTGQGGVVLPTGVDAGDTGELHVEGVAGCLWGLRVLRPLSKTVVGCLE